MQVVGAEDHNTTETQEEVEERETLHNHYDGNTVGREEQWWRRWRWLACGSVCGTAAGCWWLAVVAVAFDAAWLPSSLVVVAVVVGAAWWATFPPSLPSDLLLLLLTVRHTFAVTPADVEDSEQIPRQQRREPTLCRGIQWLWRRQVVNKLRAISSHDHEPLGHGSYGYAKKQRFPFVHPTYSTAYSILTNKIKLDGSDCLYFLEAQRSSFVRRFWW